MERLATLKMQTRKNKLQTARGVGYAGGIINGVCMARRRRSPQGNLFTRVQKELLETDKAYHDIARVTDIPANWLWQFANGRIPDPSVNRVEQLFVYLTGKTLEV